MSIHSSLGLHYMICTEFHLQYPYPKLSHVWKSQAFHIYTNEIHESDLYLLQFEYVGHQIGKNSDPCTFCDKGAFKVKEPSELVFENAKCKFIFPYSL